MLPASIEHEFVSLLLRNLKNTIRPYPEIVREWKHRHASAVNRVQNLVKVAYDQQRVVRYLRSKLIPQVVVPLPDPNRAVHASVVSQVMPQNSATDSISLDINNNHVVIVSVNICAVVTFANAAVLPSVVVSRDDVRLYVETLKFPIKCCPVTHPVSKVDMNYVAQNENNCRTFDFDDVRKVRDDLVHAKLSVVELSDVDVRNKDCFEWGSLRN